MVGVRIKEHKNFKDSVVALHNSERDHDFEWEKFEILDREPLLNKRMISKMFQINLQKLF